MIISLSLVATLVMCAAGKFPADFIFGTATAALQIEGAWLEDGKSPSVWDNLAHLPNFTADGTVPDVGPDSYHLYKEDIALMKSNGIKHYRFSISWPRIVPQGRAKSPVNQKAVAHYKELLKALVEAGITPYVTLYHWDIPAILAIQGYGTADSYFPTDFAYYAETCFKEFGDLVKNWFTFNEVWCMALLDPIKPRDKGTKPYRIAHNALLGHALAVKAYRKNYNKDGKGKIGIVLNTSMMYPKNPLSENDKEAARRGMMYSLAWIADPVFKGDYPEEMKKRAGNRLPAFTAEEKAMLKGSSDFFAVNHYFSELCENGNAKEATDYWTDRNVITSYNPEWKLTDSGWPIVPQGMYDLLMTIHSTWTVGTKIPIWITENGIAVKEPTVNEAKEDQARIDYLKSYLENVLKSITDGANVKAYFVWSLLDNFEWWDGFSKRFGMVRVDYSVPPVRTAKKSLVWYRDFIKNNLGGAEETAQN